MLFFATVAWAGSHATKFKEAKHSEAQIKQEQQEAYFVGLPDTVEELW